MQILCYECEKPIDENEAHELGKTNFGNEKYLCKDCYELEKWRGN